MASILKRNREERPKLAITSVTAATEKGQSPLTKLGEGGACLSPEWGSPEADWDKVPVQVVFVLMLVGEWVGRQKAREPGKGVL